MDKGDKGPNEPLLEEYKRQQLLDQTKNAQNQALQEQNIQNPDKIDNQPPREFNINEVQTADSP